MRLPYTIKVRSCRDARSEIRNDGGNGWTVAVHTPDTPNVLLPRNRIPQGLAQLLDEAKAYVDRRLGFGVPVDYP